MTARRHSRDPGWPKRWAPASSASNPEPGWSDVIHRDNPPGRRTPPTPAPEPTTNAQLLAAINRLTDAVLLLTDQLAAPPEPPSPPVQHVLPTFRSPHPLRPSPRVVCGFSIDPGETVALNPGTGEPMHVTCGLVPGLPPTPEDEERHIHPPCAICGYTINPETEELATATTGESDYYVHISCIPAPTKSYPVCYVCARPLLPGEFSLMSELGPMHSTCVPYTADPTELPPTPSDEENPDDDATPRNPRPR
jgi:hypothetical protein